MENQANNDIVLEIVNTKDTIDNKTNQFSESRLTVAAIFAFFPYTCMFGVHNFILKQYKKGIAHIAAVIMFFVLFVMSSELCSRIHCHDMVLPIMFLLCPAVALYILAIVEGMQILRLKKQDSKAWSILSIIATMIPVMLYGCCFAISGGNTNVDGSGSGGAIWWLVVGYYLSFGIPLAFISIVFGIIGLKTNLRWLSIISLLLKAITIISIILLLFVR